MCNCRQELGKAGTTRLDHWAAPSWVNILESRTETQKSKRMHHGLKYSYHTASTVIFLKIGVFFLARLWGISPLLITTSEVILGDIVVFDVHSRVFLFCSQVSVTW